MADIREWNDDPPAESGLPPKATWGPGPWQDEPNKIHWVDGDTGLDCLMHRGFTGAWCGYVGVQPGHPAHGVGYDALQALDVHGGLTYSDRCMETANEAYGICHVPFDGRPHDVWWIGFDCGHFMDLSPALAAIMDRIHPDRERSRPTDVYRDRAYVEEEVRGLARQLRNYHG